MTETSFMHFSSEQELVHNRLRFQKWPPSGPKNSKSLYLTPCLRTSAAGKHGGGVATGGGVGLLARYGNVVRVDMGISKAIDTALQSTVPTHIMAQ